MTTNLAKRPGAFAAILGEAEFRVSRRPDPIPVDLRRSWRVAVILVTLASSRSNRASHQKLLLLTYALRNPSFQDTFLEVLEGSQSPFFLQVRVDPALSRALDFAIGLGLVTRVGGTRFELTETGLGFAKQLDDDGALLASEKEFLARTRRLATEKRVGQILRWR